MLKNKDGDEIILPAWGSWPEAVHVFDEKSIWAVNSAIAAERPLLVRGEPGSGKSQLARAAASAMGRLFISEVVHARSECQDLQYYFDAVGRLGEAQTLAAAGECGIAADALAHEHFLSPGALWWVFNWKEAEKQFEKSNKCVRKPQKPLGWQPEMGSVLLIDEIDKADSDLPNGLLETLGNGAFTVPYRDNPVVLPKGIETPLVVITTNEERELPSAFVRRCMVLHLGLPDKEDELIQWLMDRGKAHFGNKCSEEVCREAAVQLVKDRREAKKQGLPAPGQAEYLDMLRAVSRLSKTEKKQLEVLEKIRDFALIKHPGV
jgi:MoxR-like ATPase